MKGSAGSAWPTATSVMTTGAGSEGRDGGLNLQTAATSWLTPRVTTGEYTRDGGEKGKERLTIGGQAAMWGTPRASDGEKGGPNMAFGAGGTPLPSQAANWPTPASRDHKGENSEAHLTNGTGRLHLDQLPNAVAFLFSRPAPVTPPHGLPSSDPRPTWRRLRRLVISTHGRAVWKRMAASGGKRRLNPNFVAFLMGWPIGHPSCACSATEFSRWQRHMRGALSAMPTASGQWIWKPPAETHEPVQMSLL